MTDPKSIDGVLIEWGDRLFYPGNHVVRARPEPRLRSQSLQERAAGIRRRIEATVARRAPQVMVKVTGGGRGMRAIVAHFRYISKNGRLDIEDDQASISRGKTSLRELADDWCFGGSFIDDQSARREAFNIILSMPRGTDAVAVQRAAREFARAEFADHKYVMVLHEHQANPHVHLSVRAESKYGQRLNPRKTDLHRWREVFAEKLRGLGIDAEATRQPTRGASRSYPVLWREKASQDGRLRKQRPAERTSPAAQNTRRDAMVAWKQIAGALRASGDPRDRELARSIDEFTRGRIPQRSGRVSEQRLPERQTPSTLQPARPRDTGTEPPRGR